MVHDRNCHITQTTLTDFKIACQLLIRRKNSTTKCGTPQQKICKIISSEGWI